MSRTSKSRPPQSTRINLRVDAGVKATLVQAAKLQHQKLTEFMLNSSRAAAEIALAVRTRFVLPPDKWTEFNAALDAPPREIPALNKLFTKNPVFESA